MAERTPCPPWHLSDNLKPAALSEQHLADVFAERYADTLKYVREVNRWFSWTGADGWQEDRTAEANRLAVALCREACYWPEAASLTPNECRWLCSLRVAGNVRDLAKCHSAISAICDDVGIEPPKRCRQYRTCSRDSKPAPV